MTELKDCTLKNTSQFSLNDVETVGKVLKCSDGDTLTVAIEYLGKFYKFIVRLAGLDTPEITSENSILRGHAENAKDELLKLLGASSNDDGVAFFQENIVLVRVHCKKFDKYGRLLVELYVGESASINEYLLKNKFAYPYTGGTKLSLDEQLEFYRD